MNPTTLKATLKAMIPTGKNVYVEGSPGLGKTEIVKQAVTDLGTNYHVVFKHAPTMQPEDLALPFRSPDGRLDFARAGWLPLAGDYEEGKHVVLFIDELPQADMSIQKTLANLMQEREAYGVALHNKVSFVATGNGTSHRAGANRLLSHLRNRMLNLKFEAHLDSWCQWALDNDVRPEVIAFLRFRPDQLNEFDPNRDVNPTPRVWSQGVNDLLHAVDTGAIPQEAEFEICEGYVGEGAAVQFQSFVKMYRKLPNPDAVLMRAADHPVPTEPSVLYALSGALAHRCTVNNIDRVVEFGRRMPPEYCVLILLDAIRKTPMLQSTKAFTDWAIKDGAKVLL
jgi:hypothetical protein